MALSLTDVHSATEAGVTLPTNIVALIQLGPVAASLASALPTAPVLSVLETAAPSGFLSNILHNPSYASSFESAFAAGSSPSWFNALPTDVRLYLHTYSNFGGAATAAGAVLNAISSNATSGSTASMTGGAGVNIGSTSASISNSATTTNTAGTSSVALTTAGSSQPSNPPSPSSTTSAGGSPSRTGTIVTGLAWLIGLMGLVFVL